MPDGGQATVMRRLRAEVWGLLANDLEHFALPLDRRRYVSWFDDTPPFPVGHEAEQRTVFETTLRWVLLDPLDATAGDEVYFRSVSPDVPGGEVAHRANRTFSLMGDVWHCDVVV
jgi:hypothetical protein